MTLLEVDMETILEVSPVMNGTNGFSQRALRPLNEKIADQEFPDVDLESIKRAVRTILKAIGEDPDRSGLLDTPRRVAKMYAEMFSGLQQDPARHLRVTFPEEYSELVLVKDIPRKGLALRDSGRAYAADR
jgi:hypothetical protein